MKWLERYTEQAYAALRIMSGFMFTFHGAQKILGIYSDFRPPAFSQIWVGGLIELIGGIAIMLGLKTRPAAFLCSGTMAVAYFQFHWKFQMDRNWLPALNQGESAALYCFVFLLIACRGTGRWALGRD